jgi:flagellar motility protein MotE (MotC chaperone)
MKKRLRLVDAVVIAAVALLALKGIDHLRRDGAPGSPSAQVMPGASVVHGSDQLPEFARVLAHARTNYIPPDVIMTGSTDDAEEFLSAREQAVDALAGPMAPSRAEESILDRLGQRRQELQQRNQDMELREQLLEQAEKRLEARLQEMRDRDQPPEVAAQQEAAKAGLKNLVLMYETMRPKEAARVFDRLGLDILVPVVVEMNPRKMAEVLAVMSPEAAERLTVALARRAQGIPSGGQARNGSAMPTSELPAIDLPRRN